MNRHVKNNLILTLTLIIAGIAALTLAILTAVEHRRFTKNHEILVKLTKDINDLNSQIPAPMQENMAPMREDLAFYQNLKKDFQYKFGTPLQAALGKFLAALKTLDGKSLDEKQFCQKFRRGWDEDGKGWDSFAADEAKRKFYVTQFKNRFKNWSAAIDAFRKEAENRTTEPMTNVDAIIFRLIGVDMPMKAEQIDEFNKISAYAVRKAVGGKIKIDEKIQNFGMPSGTAVNADESALVPFHWDVIGDLVKRMAAASLFELDDFKIRKLQGEKNGGLRKYHYTFTVLGTMKMIRNFSAVIDKAGSDNRFYLVQSVFLFTHEDPVPKLLNPGREGAEKNTASPTVVRRTGNRDGGEEKDDRKGEEAPAEKPLEEGSVVIGADDCVYAVFDVEYIVWAER